MESVRGHCLSDCIDREQFRQIKLQSLKTAVADDRNDASRKAKEALRLKVGVTLDAQSIATMLAHQDMSDEDIIEFARDHKVRLFSHASDPN